MKRNTFKIDGDVCTIFLKRKNGEIVKTIIDSKNLFVLNIARWFAWYSPSTKTYYVQGNIKENGKHKVVYLHRIIKGSPKGLSIDHINHNTLDNRECNLRAITTEKNCQNRVKHSLDAYKLKKEDVKYILESKLSDYELANKFNVTAALIWNTRHNKCYRGYYPEIKRFA